MESPFLLIYILIDLLVGIFIETTDAMRRMAVRLGIIKLTKREALQYQFTVKELWVDIFYLIMFLGSVAIIICLLYYYFS